MPCDSARALAVSEEVRWIIHVRALFLAGRAIQSGGEGSAAAWLCTTAPLWVLVRVCQLLIVAPK
jgi:hypothetical protein